MGAAQSRPWAAVAVWLVIQLTLTSLPGRAIPVALPHPEDWIAHAGMYAGLGFLIARAASLGGWPARRLVWMGVLLSLLGVLDELHQLFIPGRDAELGDWAADTTGAAAGLLMGARLMTTRLAAWLR